MRKLLFIAALLVTMGAQAGDIKTIVVKRQPQMTSQNFEKKIKSDLRLEKGIKRIDNDLTADQVVITYDAGVTTPEKLTENLRKMGYEPTPTAGRPSVNNPIQNNNLGGNITKESTTKPSTKTVTTKTPVSVTPGGGALKKNDKKLK